MSEYVHPEVLVSVDWVVNHTTRCAWNTALLSHRELERPCLQRRLCAHHLHGLSLAHLGRHLRHAPQLVRRSGERLDGHRCSGRGHARRPDLSADRLVILKDLQQHWAARKKEMDSRR